MCTKFDISIFIISMIIINLLKKTLIQSHFFPFFYQKTGALVLRKKMTLIYIVTRGGKELHIQEKKWRKFLHYYNILKKFNKKKNIVKKNIYTKNIENYKWGLLSQISTLRKWKFPWACKSKIKFPWAWMLDGFFFSNEFASHVVMDKPRNLFMFVRSCILVFAIVRIN